MEFISKSLKDSKNIACDFARNLQKGDVVFLHGELGSGKTTFVNYVANELGYTGVVQSPTFVLERIYNTKSFDIHHIDLYRMTSKDLGLLEFVNEVYENDVYLIEWPEVTEGIIKPTKELKFEHLDENSRKITIKIL